MVVMEILETQDDTGGVETGAALTEHVCVDVHHEVSTGGVFHHETDVGICLRGGQI